MSHDSPNRARASGRVLSAAIAVAALAGAAGLGGCIGDIGGAGQVGAGDGPPPATQASCEAGPSAARSPLRRLTRAEYRATLRDLLDIPAPELDDFVADEMRGAFDLNVSAPSALTVEKLRAFAAAFAAQARERFAEGCDVEETACATDFVGAFGLRAYRRPLAAEEIDELVALYEDERATSDGATALELVVQTILMSPHFVYHVEIGRADAATGDAVPLGGYEVAARLSYFLWGTLPDDALFEDAADGTLDSPEGVETAARRMLDDDRAADMLAEFERQWLDLRNVDDVVRDPEAFPQWSPDLLVSMRTETRTFFEEVILRGDARLDTLLTAPYSWLDAPLAEHYGAEAPDAEATNDGGFGKVDLPGDERAGLLTQGLVLVTHAYPAKNSWVHRGKFVRERLLCSPMPPPPPNVDFSNTNDPNRLTNEQCKGCHLLMDPIGKAFDTYDPTGQFATVDAEGEAIDPSGEVFSSDIGAFDSIVELAGDLAADETVHACIAGTWATYALGRSLGGEDACAKSSIEADFAASGRDLRELFVAIARSDAFRFTKAGQ